MRSFQITVLLDVYVQKYLDGSWFVGGPRWSAKHWKPHVLNTAANLNWIWINSLRVQRCMCQKQATLEAIVFSLLDLCCQKATGLK